MVKNYVVKEHKANYTLGKLEPEILLKFLDQCISIVNGLQSYEEEIGELLKDVSDREDITLAKVDLESILSDDEIDELLETLESSEIQNFDALSAFYSNFYSTWDSLNVHVRNTIYIISEFNNLVRRYAESWTCPSMSDLKTTLLHCNTIIKNLLFIAYFEFDMNSVNVKENDGRFYIDEIYDKYCKHYNLNPEEHTKTINDLRAIYKIKLSIFEEHPELEEPFEELMGPNMVNIDEDKLTLQIVKDVINGKITDTQAYEMVKVDGVEAASTLTPNPSDVKIDLANMGLF